MGNIGPSGNVIGQRGKILDRDGRYGTEWGNIG